MKNKSTGLMLKHEKHINILKRFIRYSTKNFDSFFWFHLAQMDIWLVILLLNPLS